MYKMIFKPMTESPKHYTVISREDALEILHRLRLGESVPPELLNFRGVSLPGEDLSGLDLFGADFSEADLAGADLTGARLFKAHLVKTVLIGAKLHKADLTGCDLSGANLEDAHACEIGLGMAVLRGARLFSCDLSRGTLTKANLENADLRCANLRGARMREAEIVGADLTGASLYGINLSLSNLEGSIFNNADMREARLRSVTNFEKAEWIGVDIRDINFSGAYRLRRFIVDQNYLYEFKNVNAYSRFVYWIWLISSDCGRSLFRWCICIAGLSVVFAWVYTLVGIDYGENPNWIAPIYYSVVTLSTLGYGDILPVTPLARLVALVEVMTGYVMLGGLLSIFANKMARRGE